MVKHRWRVGLSAALFAGTIAIGLAGIGTPSDSALAACSTPPKFYTHEDVGHTEMGTMKLACNDEYLSAKTKEIDERASAGIAGAMAMAAIPNGTGTFTVGTAAAAWNEEYAFAAGIGANIGDNLSMKLGATYADDEFGGAAGVSWSF